MDTVIFVPSHREAELFVAPQRQGLQTFVVGIGLVAAGISATKILMEEQPQRAILLGIAGTFNNDILPVESVCCFEHVRVEGLGVAEDHGQLSFADLGWSHGQLSSAGRIALSKPTGMRSEEELLSVAAASGTASVAARRQQAFTQAVAEDMEGFAVALACDALKIPLCIVRAVSNCVGDRDKARWKFEPAMDALNQHVADVIDLSNTWLNPS